MLAALIAALAALLGVAGAGAPGPPPTVFAAASLADVLPAIAPEARLSFAGSGTIGRQIRQGAPADAVVSADPSITRELHRDGLVDEPRVLALNRLALIVPRGNPAGIRSVDDLGEGVALVIAGPQAPAGAYARALLRELGREDALAGVVSEEPDVRSVAGKVALGQADAGFVYATDARAAGERVREIALPPGARPDVRYEIAVVAGARQADAARAVVERATGPGGRALLRAAGFGLPR